MLRMRLGMGSRMGMQRRCRCRQIWDCDLQGSVLGRSAC